MPEMPEIRRVDLPVRLHETGSVKVEAWGRQQGRPGVAHLRTQRCRGYHRLEERATDLPLRLHETGSVKAGAWGRCAPATMRTCAPLPSPPSPPFIHTPRGRAPSLQRRTAPLTPARAAGAVGRGVIAGYGQRQSGSTVQGAQGPSMMPRATSAVVGLVKCEITAGQGGSRQLRYTAQRLIGG